MPELLLGFDVRATPSGLDGLWTEDLQRRFLLREVPRPLSVDTGVWPRTLPRPRSETRGIVYYNAEDARKQRRPGQVVIGITVHERPVQEPFPFRRLEPPPDWGSWSLLGFDVADRFLLSGLTNCAWDDDRSAWARKWAPELSESHLFADGSAAARLAIEMDDRVPEHAPFYAYGIYLAP